MKLGISTMLLLLGTAMSLKAQHQEIHEKPEIWRGKQNKSEDTTSLLYAFKQGQIHGHFRYFFMATDNAKNLSDYHANGAGGGIRYETAKFHNFQFGVSGFYVFNLSSSDLTKADPTTGQMNRYEIGLFDQENPTNKKDIDRLEEFYLKYNFKKSHIAFGRQLINTPFINLQDGRMRPTGVEGLWFELADVKKTKIEGGWLYAISPRGTTKWFDAGESIGIYPVGVNTEGVKSGYAGHVETKGVAMLGINHQVKDFLKVQFWDMYVENVFNTAMFQADFEMPLNNRSQLFAAGQVIRQNALNQGGNEDPTKRYFNEGGKSLTFGGKIGWKNRQLEASFNYNRITGEGRYLVPREWGREPFFTFIPRERNEGLGNVHAYVGKINYNIPNKRLKTGLALGYFQVPDVKNYKLNKYGLPSYSQINFDVRYNFVGVLKGLEAQALIAHKIKQGNVYDNDKFVINKVDMTLYNLILNYHF